MYSIYDKPMAIREVQRYLLLISQVDKTIQEVPVDGIYGEPTRIAVSEFQKQQGLRETGKVNQETFDLLYLRFLEIRDEKDAESYVTVVEAFPLRLGDRGVDVMELNTMLRQLGEYYVDLVVPESEAFFSTLTEDAVKSMQKRFRERESGMVSKKLFARLRREIRARENTQNIR